MIIWIINYHVLRIHYRCFILCIIIYYVCLCRYVVKIPRSTDGIQLVIIVFPKLVFVEKIFIKIVLLEKYLTKWCF
ncbi:hypothetical protein Hanom_Chr02g00166221 [Helianthus anomalus]